MLQPSQPMRGRVWIFNTEGTRTRLVAILWQKHRCQMFPSEQRNGCDFAHHISQKQGKQLRQKVLRAIDRTRPFFRPLPNSTEVSQSHCVGIFQTRAKPHRNDSSRSRQNGFGDCGEVRATERGCFSHRTSTKRRTSAGLLHSKLQTGRRKSSVCRQRGTTTTH